MAAVITCCYSNNGVHNTLTCTVEPFNVGQLQRSQCCVSVKYGNGREGEGEGGGGGGGGRTSSKNREKELHSIFRHVEVYGEFA